MNGLALDLLLQAVPVAFVMFLVLNFGGLLTWVERKQSAIMQDRIGANRASISVLGFRIRILGLLHPLADAVKMLTKESSARNPNSRFLAECLARNSALETQSAACS